MAGYYSKDGMSIFTYDRIIIVARVAYLFLSMTGYCSKDGTSIFTYDRIIIVARVACLFLYL